MTNMILILLQRSDFPLIVLVRSNDINPDPRLQKYIDFLVEKDEPFLVLGWNREKEIIEKPNHKYFHLQAKYGAMFSNILNKIRWFIFVYIYLVKNKKDYDIVHACDFDTAFPVYLSKFTTKKKMIFDVFDWMSDTRNKGLIYSIIGFLERKIFAGSDYAIICEEERRKQIPVVKDDVFVMPNIPTINYTDNQNIKDILNEQKKTYDIILSYVGVLVSDRGIEDLLEFVLENKNVCLNIAGFGSFEEKIKAISEQNNNIVFWGKVHYNRGLNLMKHADLIIAMYYRTNPLHEYAAPNKYYEGLMLGVPIVTTENTLVGEKTKKYDTGFVIAEGKYSLERLLLNSDLKQQIQKKRINTNKLWNGKYKDYIQDFLEQEYYPICHVISNKA